jgi:tetratricopeptide (TPR) repeat protein
LHYAESLSPRLSHGWGELRALFADEWKYIHGPRPELFHLSADPRELDNRIDAEPARAAQLEAKLADLLGHISVEQPLQAAAPDPETRRRLEALGYIQGGPAENVEIREALSREGVPPQDRVDRTSDLSRIKDFLVRRQPLMAKELLERLLQEDPESPYYLEMLARTEAALGRFEEAIAVLARLQASGGAASGSGRLMVEIARRLARLGRIEEACQQLERGTELQADADAFFLLGALSEKLGRDREAAAAYQRAVEADRAHGPALVALAIRRARAGARAQAERLFRQAVDNDPYYPKAHYNLGVFLQSSGRHAEAVERFERAIDLDPDYLQAYEAASLAYRALGRGAEADAVLARQRARSGVRGREVAGTPPPKAGTPPPKAGKTP